MFELTIFYFLLNPLILMGFPLFAWETAESGWEWDTCELARSTVVLANWHFILLFQHNFWGRLAGLHCGRREQEVAGEAIAHRQSLLHWCFHDSMLMVFCKQLGMNPLLLLSVMSPLCVSVSFHHSHLSSSYPSLNRWFFSTEILNLSLKQKSHPIFPNPFLSSLSSFLPMEVFEIAQVPEKGLFFPPFVLWLCVPSSLYLPFVILFCLPPLSVFSPSLNPSSRLFLH